MCYVNSSLKNRQVGYVGDEVTRVHWDLFTDADFAGDMVSQKSTSGVHLTLMGPNTMFPLHGISKKQTVVSFSTPEAEMVAGCFGYRSIFIPAMQLWCVMLPNLATPRFHEDNQAMIFVVGSGHNPTMRHIGRVH